MISVGSVENRVSLFRFVVLLLKPYRTRLILAVFAIIVSAMSLLGIGNSLRLLINSPKVLGGEHLSSLKESFSFLSALMFLLMISSYARIYLLASASEYLIYDIRRNLFKAIFKPVEVCHLSASQINVYLGEESIQLQGILTLTLPTALTSILVVAGGMALLIYTSPFLTILLLFVFLFAASFLYMASKKFRLNARLSQAALDQMRSFIETIFVQFGLMHKPDDSFSKVESLFERHNHLLFECNLNHVKVRAWGIAFVTSVLFVGIGIIVLCGINEISHGFMTSGDLTAFLFYAITVSGAVAQFSEMVSPLQRAAAILERFIQTISRIPPDEWTQGRGAGVSERLLK